MRIAGGVLMLLVGLWSIVGGSCHLACGTAIEKGAGLASGMAKAAQEAGGKVDGTMLEGFDKARTMGSGAKLPGIIIIIAGLLCVVGGILFLVNKAKMFAFVAAGVGILGEILSIVMTFFTPLGAIKIIILAFCAFAATKIGQPTSS